jgi:membrane-bound serine protease (ClpP class)
MTAIILLFVTGALLLAAEVFLPGGIAGVIGGLALSGGSFLAFQQYGATVGSIATFAALVLLAIMLYAELVWLPNSRLGRAMVVDATVDGQSQPPLASAEVIGQVATALTPLSPSGFVAIAGKRYEAFSRSGMASRGTQLTVVGIDNFRLIVSENKSS